MVLKGLDLGNCSLETFSVACHTDVFPHNVAEFLVDGINSPLALDSEQTIDAGLNGLLGSVKFWSVGICLRLSEFL